MFKINPKVQGVTPELIELYKKVYTSTIGHMTDFGFALGLQPISRPVRFIGNAVTVRIPHMDSTAVHIALDMVGPGDVVLVDMSGDETRACWGGVVSYQAKARNIEGVVVSGCITDYNEIRELGLQVYSLGVSPLTTRIMGMEGEINVPIKVCGVPVNPGDLVIADDDGVFIVDPKKAEDYAIRAIKAQDAEPGMKKNIDSGISLATMSGAIKYAK